MLEDSFIFELIYEAFYVYSLELHVPVINQSRCTLNRFYNAPDTTWRGKAPCDLHVFISSELFSFVFEWCYVVVSSVCVISVGVISAKVSNFDSVQMLFVKEIGYI
jgi:hypothetical protein